MVLGTYYCRLLIEVSDTSHRNHMIIGIKSPEASHPEIGLACKSIEKFPQ